MTAPAAVCDLVARFEQQRDDYRCGLYKEAQLRRDFLDPFFAALGWDVDNRRGYSEAFREVIHEYSLRARGGTQTVDYCFQLGREPIFFVEAKKPAVDIRHEVGPAYQLRNYGWNRKLPVSILTDFEEFAVYDCRTAPTKRDKATLPFRTIDFSNTQDKSRHERMVELVERMLSLHKRLPSAGTPHQKTVLERQIEATDRQIDRLVYELYDLSDQQIAIVEDRA